MQGIYVAIGNRQFMLSWCQLPSSFKSKPPGLNLCAFCHFPSFIAFLTRPRQAKLHMYIPVLSSSIESGLWCKSPGQGLVPSTKCYLKQVTYDDVPFEQLLTAPGKKIREERVHERTGYSQYIMDLMWGRYKEHLQQFRPSERKKDKTKCYFLLMYVWIHLKPTARNTDAMMWTEPTGFISEKVCISKFYHLLITN